MYEMYCINLTRWLHSQKCNAASTKENCVVLYIFQAINDCNSASAVVWNTSGNAFGCDAAAACDQSLSGTAASVHPAYLASSADFESVNAQSRLMYDHQSFLKCPNCPKIFLRHKIQNYERHVIVHTNHKPFSCDKCDYKANQASNLRRHQRFKHTQLAPGQI